MTLSRRIATLAATLAVLAAPAAVRADPIVLNQWYTFGFGGPGTMAVDGATFILGQRSVASGSPAWTINTAQTFTFLLTDGFNHGDSFTLFDNAANVGATPGAAVDGGTCGNNEVACFNDPAASHRAYGMAAGAHSYEIRVDVSPFGSGAAFFCLATTTPGRQGCDVQVSAAPEPATYGLLATGLLGVFGIARRRRA